jgi:hypothetical protein
LFAQALHGQGELYERVTALHARALEGLRRDRALRRRFDRCRTTFTRERPRLRRWFQQAQLTPGDFLRAQEHLLPILREPEFLHRRLPRPATELLLRLPGLQALRGPIEKIFSRSKFTVGNRLFRTRLHRGQPVIEGEDAPSLSALAGIAHELGHCLAERHLLRRQRCDAAYSETVAHFFEELAVRDYLETQGSAREQVAWERYQRKVDGCNFFFFQEEARALRGLPRVRPRLFPPNTYVFRESLYSMPGYQVNYARASLTKARWLACKRTLAGFLAMTEGT